MPRNKQKNLARAVAHRAERMKDVRPQKRVSVAPTGCSERVHKALTLIDGPAAPRARQEECGVMCLPQVALYAAGHRKTRKDAVHIIK